MLQLILVFFIKENVTKSSTF